MLGGFAFSKRQDWTFVRVKVVIITKVNVSYSIQDIYSAGQELAEELRMS